MEFEDAIYRLCARNARQAIFHDGARLRPLYEVDWQRLVTPGETGREMFVDSAVSTLCFGEFCDWIRPSVSKWRPSHNLKPFIDLFRLLVLFAQPYAVFRMRMRVSVSLQAIFTALGHLAIRQMSLNTVPTELSWIRSRFRRYLKTTSFVELRWALMGCFTL